MCDEKNAWPTDAHFETLSTSELHVLILRACRAKIRWTRRAAGLIYLADRADLPRKKGYRDTHHYAAVVGGFSRNHVNEILRVGRAVASTAALLKLFLE